MLMECQLTVVNRIPAVAAVWNQLLMQLSPRQAHTYTFPQFGNLHVLVQGSLAQL